MDTTYKWIEAGYIWYNLVTNRVLIFLGYHAIVS